MSERKTLHILDASQYPTSITFFSSLSSLAFKLARIKPSSNNLKYSTDRSLEHLRTHKCRCIVLWLHHIAERRRGSGGERKAETRCRSTLHERSDCPRNYPLVEWWNLLFGGICRNCIEAEHVLSVNTRLGKPKRAVHFGSIILLFKRRTLEDIVCWYNKLSLKVTK